MARGAAPGRMFPAGAGGRTCARGMSPAPAPC